jgi:hypothetical protein
MVLINDILSSQKLVGNLDKTTIANLGRQHQRSLNSYFKSSLRIFVFVWSYKLLFHTIYIV